MNTKIEYRYRDASNYKDHYKAVVKGEITKEQYDEIWNCLDDSDDHFIAAQVGLPADGLRGYDVNEDDHCWYELCEITPTEEEPTQDMTIDELVKRFKKAKNNWDEATYAVVCPA